MADVERLLLGSRFPPNFLDSFSVIGGRNSKKMHKNKIIGEFGTTTYDI